MDTTKGEGIRCDKCGSPRRISKSPVNRGKLIQCPCFRKKYQSDWYEANKAEVKVKAAAYYQKNSEKAKKNAKEWRLNNLTKHRHDAWAAKLRRMGSSPEIYNAAVEKQGGLCALCGKTNGKIRLCQDHCHRRIVPRGALCNRCNFVVGQFEAMREDIPMIESYLAQYD